MAEFLSPEWLAALADAAAGSALSAASTRPLTIEQRVKDAHDAEGEVCYHLVIEPSGTRITAGPAATPDVTMITDYETARALHEGRTTAQFALRAGRLKIRGRPSALRELAELGDVFATVRAATTFR